MKFVEAFKRQDEALRDGLRRLEESGESRSSSRHALEADNETAGELGAFEQSPEEEEPPFDEARRDGFIIRTRRDALVARKNSARMLDAVERIEAAVDQIRILTTIIGVSIMVVLVLPYLLGR